MGGPGTAGSDGSTFSGNAPSDRPGVAARARGEVVRTNGCERRRARTAAEGGLPRGSCGLN